MSKNSKQKTSQPSEANKHKPTSNFLNLALPADKIIWEEARRLIGDRNVRVESLAVAASQDPVLVIELLKSSNAMFFSGGKAPITSCKTAIVRLGSDVVIDILEDIAQRPALQGDDIVHWFDIHRNRCKRTAIISRMLGEVVVRPLADDCHSSGLLLYIGDLLAVAHLGQLYVSLAEEHSRSGVKYQLQQTHNFDVEQVGLKYLHRNGIPDTLLCAIDFNGQARTKERAIIKPIIWGAGELIDAFDSDRWEKLAPGKILPAKSNLRLLQLTDAQYLKVYERASEYLFSARLLEERRRQEAVSTTLRPSRKSKKVIPDDELPISVEQQSLDSDIMNLLKGIGQSVDDSSEEDSPSVNIATTIETSTSDDKIEKTLPKVEDQFNLKATLSTKKVKARAEQIVVVSPPQLRTNNGNAVIEKVLSSFDLVSTSEELISKILAMLVDDGPFEKSALIVVSHDRKNALVVCSRGPIGNGQKLEIDDPLSPLAQCFSKVKSFGNKESADSPFGSKAFALAPIDADHETPVALYADCGNNGSLAFEHRRVFRTVVDILNQKLPSLPGGIPVEVKT